MVTAIYDIAAPAKLNLFLHIVGRRPDGYHLLQSVFVLIDWCDTLHVERRTDGRLMRHDLTQPLPTDDLCLRAARALQQASGCALGADISIAKHVPSGAGMGGGSSDAASVLLALNRLWQLHWPLPRLLALGLTLGADVPFFIGGHNAWVEGIGEKLTPIKLAPLWLAVVKPPASIETRALFAHPLLVRDSEPVIVEGFGADEALVGNFDVALRTGYGHNDLQAAAQDVCPEVSVACEWLERFYGNSRMTGSGSAVFARLAAPSALPELPADWQGRICCSLPAHPLAGWAK